MSAQTPQPRGRARGMKGREEPQKGFADLEHAHKRLQHLYEISKLLTRFESVEETSDAIVSLVARTLPLRSAAFVMKTGRSPRCMVWTTPGLSSDRLRTVMAHARASYAYFSGSETGESLEPDAQPTRLCQCLEPLAEDQELAADDEGSFAAIPLVVDHGYVFGAFQWEGVARLDERDLGFVNAVVNQLAIALSRQANFEAKLAAEEEVKARLAFTHAVTLSLSEGVVAIDPDGRITFLNPAAELLLGWTGEEALGEHLQEVIRLRREDGTAVRAELLLMRPIRSGESVRSDEHLIVRRDGTMLPISYVSCPLRQAGKVSGAVIVVQDILEVRRAEKTQHFLSDITAALASSLEYRHTLSTLVRLSVPILADLSFLDLLEEDGQVQHYEMAFADVKSENIAEHVRCFEPGSRGQTPWTRVLSSGKSVLLHDLSGPTPEHIECDHDYAELMQAISLKSMMVVPLLGQGHVLGALTFVAASSDRHYTSTDLALAEEIARRAVTAINNARLYQNARRAVRTREDILAVVSHDLRNPLNNIFLSTALLVRTLSANDENGHNRELVEGIQHSAAQMNHLIGDLLDFAKIEVGQLSVERRRHPAQQLLQESIELLAAAAAQKSILLEGDLPGGNFDVLCDKARILQVLSNLVGNAIKFTPMEGTITVSIDLKGAEAWFTVADTGPGIPPEQLPHIFKRFWQAAGAGRMGIGLGLSIARGIVEAHGGRIWVESQVAVGSTACFVLPLAG